MKIAYIDHSFHKKTKSNDFLFKILSERYEMERFWDHRWRGGRGVSFKRIKEKGFDTLLIFQAFYNPHLLKKKYGFNNIIWVPMADSYGGEPISFFKFYSGFKIIAFSEEIYTKSLLADVDTLKLKFYFPTIYYKRKNFDTLKIFFWYRKEKIHFEHIKKLFHYGDISKIYIHNAPDPDCKKKLNISRNDIKKYNIIIGNWFDNRDKYYEMLNDYNVYIAPREREGIGLSFLEAMSRGLIVFANNNVTMNEYIRNGFNGVLFDIDNIQPIPKSILNKKNLKGISENSYRLQEEGFKKWTNSKEDIFSFIEKRNKRNNFSFTFIKKNIGKGAESLLNFSSYLKSEKKPEWKKYIDMIKMDNLSLRLKFEAYKILNKSPFSFYQYDFFKKTKEGIILFLDYVVKYYYEKRELSEEEKKILKKILEEKLKLIGNKESILFAEIYYILKDYENSLKFLQNVIKDKDSEFEGRAYFLLGNVKKILGHKNWNLYLKRAVQYSLRNNHKTTVEMYKIASLYKVLGNINRAVFWFNRVKKLSKNNILLAGVEFHLGEINLKRGNKRKALKNFRKCLELNRFHKKASEYIEELEE